MTLFVAMDLSYATACDIPHVPDRTCDHWQGETMNLEEANKRKVLQLLDLLMNKRDYEAAKAFFIPDYVQHSAISIFK